MRMTKTDVFFGLLPFIPLLGIIATVALWLWGIIPSHDPVTGWDLKGLLGLELPALILAVVMAGLYAKARDGEAF